MRADVSPGPRGVQNAPPGPVPGTPAATRASHLGGGLEPTCHGPQQRCQPLSPPWLLQAAFPGALLLPALLPQRCQAHPSRLPNPATIQPAARVRPRNHTRPPFPSLPPPRPRPALLSPEQSSGPALSSLGPGQPLSPPRPSALWPQASQPLLPRAFGRSSPGLGRAPLLVPPCLQSASCPVALLAAPKLAAAQCYLLSALPASSVMCCIHYLTAVGFVRISNRIQAPPTEQPPPPAMPPRLQDSDPGS